MARGGKREGAGRKAQGITRKVSMTLTDKEWAQIDASNDTVAKVLRENLLWKGEMRMSIRMSESGNLNLILNFVDYCDLLAMGHSQIIDGIFKIGSEIIGLGGTVVWQKTYSNHKPIEMQEFTTVEELNIWRDKAMEVEKIRDRE